MGKIKFLNWGVTLEDIIGYLLVLVKGYFIT